MSEEAKRGPTMAAKPSIDDRKPSSAVSGKRLVVKSADMSDDMQKEAIDIAIAAFEKNNVEKDVAEGIKKEFDKKHGPTWHCIVGRNFGTQEGTKQQAKLRFCVQPPSTRRRRIPSWLPPSGPPSHTPPTAATKQVHM